MPNLTIQSAVVDAAHKHGFIALAHATTQKDTLAALEAGVDALTHSFCDEAPNDKLLPAYLKNNSFVIPTLNLSATLTGEEVEMAERLAKQALPNNALDQNTKTCFCTRLLLAKDNCKVEYAYQAVKMLHGSGIDIIA